MRPMTAFAAAIAALTVAGAVQAQTAEMTVNYILERCNNYVYRGSDGSLADTHSMSFSGDRIVADINMPGIGVAGQSFDVNNVTFDPSRSSSGVINVRCISGVMALASGCIRRETGAVQKYAELRCREPDSVINALKHYQTLHGGPVKPDDPFAPK